jgi:hypothetical protein
MADINIRFRMNLKTGERELIIDYEKDDDAMRHEHEKRHREIVEQLVGKGILSAEEAEGIKVERLVGGMPAEDKQQQHQDEAQAQGQ